MDNHIIARGTGPVFVADSTYKGREGWDSIDGADDPGKTLG